MSSRRPSGAPTPRAAGRKRGLLSALLTVDRTLQRVGLDSRTKLPYSAFVMKAGDVIKLIRRIGRKRGVAVRFEPGQGKGSHGRLYYGDKFTTVKDRSKEIGPGLLAAMVRQLGLKKSNLEN